MLQLSVVALTLYACSSAYDENEAPPAGNDGGGTAVTPNREGLGKKCATAADCPSGLCTPAGADPTTGEVLSVCTVPCGLENECLPGWSCGPLAGSATTTSACLCNARIETCNGRDDNCNGVIDDAEEAAKQCGPNGGKEWSCTNASCICAGKACSVSVPDGGAPASSTCIDPMTNGAHCGECNNACGFASECVQGSCVCEPAKCKTTEENTTAKCVDGSCRVERLISGDVAPGFALDGQQIFYFAPEALEIQKVLKTGGLPTRVTYAGGATRVLVDGLTIIYGSATEGVFYCDKDACVTPTSIAAGANGLTLHQGRIYWMSGTMVSSSLPDGGSADSFPLPGATAGVARIFVESPTRAYIAVANNPNLFRVSLQDGGTEPLSLSGPIRSGSLAADPMRLFFVGTSPDAGADIRGCTRPDCLNNNVIAGGVQAMKSLVPLLVEAGRVYFADNIGLRSCPITGCTGQPRLVVEGEITDVASDGTTLFYTRRTPTAQMLYSTSL